MRSRDGERIDCIRSTFAIVEYHEDEGYWWVAPRGMNPVAGTTLRQAIDKLIAANRRSRKASKTAK